jgi:hypothetical protein
MRNPDPSRRALIRFLRKEYRAATCGESPEAPEAEFEIECAAYWISADYHTGQTSELYSALSTSPYSPGALESGPEPGSIAEELYRAAQDWMR